MKSVCEIYIPSKNLQLHVARDLEKSKIFRINQLHNQHSLLNLVSLNTSIVDLKV